MGLFSRKQLRKPKAVSVSEEEPDFLAYIPDSQAKYVFLSLMCGPSLAHPALRWGESDTCALLPIAGAPTAPWSFVRFVVDRGESGH